MTIVKKEPSYLTLAGQYFEKALEVVEDEERFSRMGTSQVLVWLQLADIALRLNRGGDARWCVE